MEFSTTTLALIGIITAIGLIALVAVDFVTLLQDAEAKGCPIDKAGANASQGRCVMF
jgi:multidrug efflux pump subunit AcrB